MFPPIVRRLAIALLLTLSMPHWARAADEPAAPKNIRDLLQPYVDNHVLAGAVTLVASVDKVLDVQTVGYADIAANKPMPANAMFWIASMSKPITSSLLMMLVDEGKVNLDDPVEKYLPEFEGQMVMAEQDQQHQVLVKSGHPITIREVLSHTSGVPFKSRLEPRIDSLSLREVSLGLALTPLKFQPGSKYEYSNGGINTAGRIVEVVGGLPFEKFLEERLLTPLGMTDTTFWPSHEQLGRLAKSYKPGPNKQGLVETDIVQLTYPLANRERGPCPAGGLFSTADDCGKFVRLILAGGTWNGKRLLSEAAIREMTSTQTGKLQDKENGEHGYGLGFSTSRRRHGDDDPVLVGPCGHGGAYATNMWIDPQKQIITVYMVQHAGFPSDDGKKIQPGFTKLAGELFGKK